jgi:ornithine cyclodeaminase
MEFVVLSEKDVHALLPMRECIDLMAKALAALARGEAYVPLRMVVRLPDGSGLMAMMPGYLASSQDGPAALGFKAVSIFPANAQRGLDTHQGAVVLLEGDTGRLKAVMDGAAVTAIRTAAVSAVATDRLARPDAAVHAILGAGVQAGTHLEAVSEVRRIQQVRIWNRNPERAKQLAAEQGKKHRIPIEVVSTAEAAVREADIISTVTASPEPVLAHQWLKPGAHINAVGSSIPTTRELDSATVKAARVFVDRRESALNEAGDLLIPMREGIINANHIVAELGEVVNGSSPGRRSAQELTVFKSLGLAVEDVASAAFIVRRALETGAGARAQL